MSFERRLWLYCRHRRGRRRRRRGWDGLTSYYPSWHRKLTLGLTSRLEVTLNLTSRLNMTLQLTSRLSMALNLTSRVTLQVIAASIQNETLVCARAADLRDVETSSRQVAEGFLVFGSHRVLDRRGRFVVDRS